jgi:hypothetical protein
MRTQSSVSASNASLMPVWIQFKLIAYLAERTTIQIQHATRVSADLCAWRKGLQNMRLWCEQQRCGWSASTRSARVQSEGTTVATGVIMLPSTWLMPLMSLASNCQQGERQPCQT